MMRGRERTVKEGEEWADEEGKGEREEVIV